MTAASSPFIQTLPPPSPSTSLYPRTKNQKPIIILKSAEQLTNDSSFVINTKAHDLPSVTITPSRIIRHSDESQTTNSATSNSTNSTTSTTAKDAGNQTVFGRSQYRTLLSKHDIIFASSLSAGLLLTILFVILGVFMLHRWRQKRQLRDERRRRQQGTRRNTDEPVYSSSTTLAIRPETSLDHQSDSVSLQWCYSNPTNDVCYGGLGGLQDSHHWVDEHPDSYYQHLEEAIEAQAKGVKFHTVSSNRGTNNSSTSHDTSTAVTTPA